MSCNSQKAGDADGTGTRRGSVDSLADLTGGGGAVRYRRDGGRYGYREGEICEELNKEIVVLIVNEARYLVFLDEDWYVQWCRHEAIPQTPESNCVMNRVSFLETISASHMKPAGKSKKGTRDLSQFRRLLGEAVACNFSGDSAAAKSMLENAETLLRDRSEERARLWYLSAAACAAIPAAGAGIAIWIMRAQAQAFIGASAFEVVLGGCAGAIGALMSTIMGMRKVNLNASSGPMIHWVEGVARVAVGCSGGLLVALAIKGNFVLGMLNSSTSHAVGLACILTFCMVAGASERMVPSLIRQVETNGSGKDRSDGAIN